MPKFQFCLALILFFFGLSANADVLEVYSLEATELDRAFLLLNDSEGTEVVLDCASFIHNLIIDFGKDSILFYLTSSECLRDYEFLSKLPGARRCLNFSESEYFFDDCS